MFTFSDFELLFFYFPWSNIGRPKILTKWEIISKSSSHIFLKEPSMSCPKFAVHSDCWYFWQIFVWPAWMIHFLNFRDFQESPNPLKLIIKCLGIIINIIFDSFILLSVDSWPYRFILGILFGSRLMAHGRLGPCVYQRLRARRSFLPQGSSRPWAMSPEPHRMPRMKR